MTSNRLFSILMWRRPLLLRYFVTRLLPRGATGRDWLWSKLILGSLHYNESRGGWNKPLHVYHKGNIKQTTRIYVVIFTIINCYCYYYLNIIICFQTRFCSHFVRTPAMCCDGLFWWFLPAEGLTEPNERKLHHNGRSRFILWIHFSFTFTPTAT